jgi:hypothetical protein
MELALGGIGAVFVLVLGYLLKKRGGGDEAANPA